MAIVTVHHIQQSFGEEIILRDISFEMQKGERVGLVGVNGSGKTTLFKMIMGIEQPTSGSSELGETVKLPYDDQGREGIDPDSAPYEVDYSLPMRDRYVAVKNHYLAYDDLALALEDLNNDAVAKDYLGSYYDYLVQLLLMMQT